MQKIKNKTMAILISAILTISMGASIILFQMLMHTLHHGHFQHMLSSISHLPL